MFNEAGLSDKSRKGIHLGLTADTRFSERFGVGAELLYSQQGDNRSDGILTGGFQNEFKIDYITIPILAKLILANDLIYILAYSLVLLLMHNK